MSVSQQQLVDNHNDISDIFTSLIALLERNTIVGFSRHLVDYEREKYRDLFLNLFAALKPYIREEEQHEKEEIEQHFADLLSKLETGFAVTTRAQLRRNSASPQPEFQFDSTQDTPRI